MTKVHRLVLIIIDHEDVADAAIIEDVEYAAGGFVVQHDVREVQEDQLDELEGYRRERSAIELFKDTWRDPCR